MRRRLRDVTIFSGLSATDLDALAGCLERIVLEPGALLMRQGEPGDFMCLLDSGDLRVEVDGARIDTLTPGAVVGEMALITAPERSATVVAGEAGAGLWRLDRAEFEHLAADHPSLLEAAHAVARPRLERAQLAPLLADRFGAATDAELLAWQGRGRWLRLSRGEVLYSPGDAAQDVYLVVSGRLEVRGGVGERPRTAGRGAVVGEAAVVGGRERRHEVVASRETDVVAFEAAEAAASPRFMARLAADLIDGQGHAGFGGVAGARVVLLPASEGAPVDGVARALGERLGEWGKALVLSSGWVDERFGRSGVAQVGKGEELAPALAMWLEQLLRSHDHVLLVADPERTPWTDRCLDLADTALLVVGAADQALPAPSPALPTELVVVHPDDTAMPSGTARWLKALEPRAHHHVRLGVAADLDRLARRVGGRAVGLALSGGGARGYVHIGLFRALEESGVPIDVVFGTSMGAVIGAAYAVSLDAAECAKLAGRFGDRKQLMDRTLPLVALTRSQRVNETLRSILGAQTQIEDLWIPFACVSASLTAAELRVHDRGPLWRAVRASAAIPGVFTPLLAEDGAEVLVDGGVMNNLPADLLRGYLGAGRVIASNAYGGKEAGKPMSFGDDVSGWSVLRSKLLPLGRKVRAPSLLGTLMRATSLASKRLLDEAGRHADLVVTYPSSTVTSLEFDHHEETIAVGYTHAREAVSAWLGGEGPTSS